MPSQAQDARKLREMNTFPWSTTIVSGTITGRAAAASSRASMSLSRRCGSAEADMASAFAQPGRIGSGVTVRASSTLASTDLVGRLQHRRGDRAGRDVDHPGQLDPALDAVVQADHHVQRGGVDLHHLAGRADLQLPNGPSGRAASDRRVRADPVVCRPADRAENSR